ncbi:Uu.00g095850.m01.CDS01 [Anthostomella pinea]|uniref:Uu.00g095850.m01.CDS01 n=1 Tax=Anthostomella pinea TaxID=933095 RepID=A0AAI8VC62_9PEZI|nr:Uu.00g095850.m01.CDS01 [Anthostomella pinea]
MEYKLNNRVAIRQCHDPIKSLGLFATEPIAKGSRALQEPALIMHNTRGQAMTEAQDIIESLPMEHKNLVLKMYAGPSDVAPLLPVGHARDHIHPSSKRVENIIRYNAFEGFRTGCMVCAAGAFMNHSCNPNSYLYWNDHAQCVTIQALRPIARDEELTFNYIGDQSIYLTTSKQGQRLQVTDYHRRLLPGLDGPDRTIRSEDHDEAMGLLYEIAELIGEEGQHNLELALTRVEQAHLQQRLGDYYGHREKLRGALVIRQLCPGADHPSCDALVLEMHN